MVRASLGHKARLPEPKSPDIKGTAVKESYPMYAIAVKDFLKLKKWRPHQDLLADGGLIKVDDTRKHNRVIFVSHQWTSFTHPDPKNKQLKALQNIIRSLLAGKMVVRTNWALEMGYGIKMTTGQAEWKDMLEDGYLWFDYLSIPQPLAAKQKKASSEGSAAEAEIVAMNSGVSHPGMLAADHRRGSADEECLESLRLIAQLQAAVDSIPAYVERCSMMWVLVPPVQHSDFDGVCDFNSWRSRGWCRMEYVASFLARTDIPLMVITNEHKAPEYFNPCDAMKLPAADGIFTVPEDKNNVLSVLHTMTEAKAEHYAQLGDFTLARLVQAFSVVLTGGVLDKRSDHADGSAVAQLKARLFWRDDATEAAWSAETGLSLLTFACGLDDVESVKELLATSDAQRMLSLRGKKPAATMSHHKVAFSVLLRNLTQNITPLKLAMGYGSPELVTALLEAGAPVPEKDMLDCFFGSACHSPFGAMLNGRLDNMDLFLKMRPGLTSELFSKKHMGISPLGFAACMDRKHMQACFKWLLERREFGQFNEGFSTFGMTCLGWLANNPEADLECVQLLIDSGDRSLNLRERLPNRRLLKGVALTKAIGSNIGDNADRVLKSVMFRGARPIKPLFHDMSHTP